MQASKALAAEQAITLAAGVTRDLLAQGDNKGLPRPRFLVAVFSFYAILGLLSAFGQQAARVAVAFGGVAALTTVVVGPGGAAILGLLQRLSGLTTPGVAGSSSSATDSGGGGESPSPAAHLNPAGPNVSVPITGGVRSRGTTVSPITGRPPQLA